MCSSGNSLYYIIHESRKLVQTKMQFNFVQHYFSINYLNYISSIYCLLKWNEPNRHAKLESNVKCINLQLTSIDSNIYAFKYVNCNPVQFKHGQSKNFRIELLKNSPRDPLITRFFFFRTNFNSHLSVVSVEQTDVIVCK